MSYQQPNQGYYQQGGPPQQQGQSAGQYYQQGQQHPQQQQQQQQYQQQQQQQYGQPSQGGQQPSHGSGAWHASDSGSFAGGSYQIAHRDTNSILTVTLSEGGSVKSRPGAMIEMAGTIKLEGKSKFSMKKMLTGGSFYESVYTGSGLLTLAPVMLGDIAALQLDGRATWNIGKDAFLAATIDVHKETKAQGLGKAMFSGEDLFIYRVSGNGLIWVSSFGAITKRDIPAGQQHIVDNGHLVAWNCEYKIEKAGGGMFTSMKTGEGAVCRFTGPGTVYIQTRNLEEFSAAICEAAGVSTG